MERALSSREKCALIRTFFNHEEARQSACPSSCREDFAPTFWSSDKLTGSQTDVLSVRATLRFWSSDKLTGSQTTIRGKRKALSVLEQ